MNQENEKSSKKRGLLFWIIIGLTTTNVITIWLLVNEKSKVANTITISEKILVEKNTVEVDLLDLQKDYQNLQTNDAAMQLDIDAKRERIEELIKEAAKHKGDATIISKLKKETQTLRSIMQSYVRTIDSLNTLNQTLVAEKKTVLKQLGSEKEKQSILIKEKDELKSTIAKGSILSCFNISAKAVLYKRGGKKESETNKARKTEKIKVSFSLGENKIAKAGEKTIYVRIMTPDGKELAKSYGDNCRFNFNQSSGYFAGRETLNYANAELIGVTYCEGQGEYVPGNYIIEITCDGVVIGNTTLKLD
jgi:hypothetical protein